MAEVILKPLVKWPGGKSRLLKHIIPLIPQHDRYIEPFLGGGALFFSLEPRKALLNDLSAELICFYRHVQQNDEEFFSTVESLSRLFFLLGDATGRGAQLDPARIAKLALANLASEGKRCHGKPVFDDRLLSSYIEEALRTSKRPSTAAHSALYYLIRDELNSITGKALDGPYRASLFFLMRELCFGSMFRYNSAGGFNIPYGGYSYDRKDLSAKAAALRIAGGSKFFQEAKLSCSCFSDFLSDIGPRSGDFIFLDPPYDSEFCGYSGNQFGRYDHAGLKDMLSSTAAHFMVVVENTQFINELYKPLGLNVSYLPSIYSYSMRGRNDRSVEYSVMRNY